MFYVKYEKKYTQFEMGEVPARKSPLHKIISKLSETHRLKLSAFGLQQTSVAYDTQTCTIYGKFVLYVLVLTREWIIQHG